MSIVETFKLAIENLEKNNLKIAAAFGVSLVKKKIAITLGFTGFKRYRGSYEGGISRP